MGSSQIDMISNAVLKLGDDPLSSLTEDRVAATVGSNIYENIYRSMLTSQSWRFSTTKQPLSLLTAKPLNEWGFAFQLPADFLMVVTTFPRTDYEIYDDKLFSNVNQLDIDFVARVPESKLPPYFVDMCEYRLAMELAIPVTGSRSLRQEMERWFNRAKLHAQWADAQGRPNPQTTSSPFVDVRF